MKMPRRNKTKRKYQLCSLHLKMQSKHILKKNVSQNGSPMPFKEYRFLGLPI